MTKILVVEDETHVLANIVDTLDAEGFETMGTESGITGVEIARAHVPDLVICDILMPNFDGYDVLRTLREDPATQDIPLIFLTARVERSDMRKGMEMGADDYITKPYKRSELLAAVKARLQRQETINMLKDRHDELAIAEQLKTDMIRIAAHDLRSPVSSALINIAYLKHKCGSELPAECLKYIDNIEAANRQIERITSDVLSLARIELAIKKEAIEAINLTEIVAKSVQEHREAAEEKAQKLVFQPRETAIIIYGDTAQMRQVFENLIGNAIKYTPEGGRIEVRLQTTKKEAQVTVVDNGYGIPEDQQAQLFEPFFRVNSKETKYINGTGLGLHLVKRIVERHNGRVLFRSEYGKGSVFAVKLPLAAETNS